VGSIGYGGGMQDQREGRIRKFTAFREENLKDSGHADERAQRQQEAADAAQASVPRRG
jgi:hypothetical protein